MSYEFHIAKKAKSTAGTQLYSELDLSKLTIAAVPDDKNETKFAEVTYNGGRLAFKASPAAEPMRAPFGVDDGSKFKSKPSVKLELKDQQLAFFRGVEEKVIATAITNKDEWFPGVKPAPSETDIRKAFSSRVTVDVEGKYPATLRVNVNLSDDEKKKLKVHTTKLLPNGKIEPAKPGSFKDIEYNDCVAPVLKTAGGVWIKKTKKLTDNCFGIIFEATELLVVKGAEASGACSFDDEVASDAEEEGGDD